MTTPGAVLGRHLDYIYFGLIGYGMLNVALGIYVPLLAGGGLLLLAAYCIWRLRATLRSAYAQLLLPLWCGIAFIAVQVVIYDSGLWDGNNVVFVNWMLGLIIVQSLLLRPGFLHRFGAAMIVIGALLLPYLVANYAGSASERSGLEHSITIANPNDLAAWFGFCALYCIIIGIETKRATVRVLAATVATGCALIVGLTVSRAPLVAIAIGTVIAARRILRRGFLPVLVFAIFTGIVFVTGIFDQAIGLYAGRGFEDTGRLDVWPFALDRFIASPLVGVGLDRIATDIPGSGQAITPHNSVLYIALASGIVPTAFFIGFLIRAVQGTLHLTKQGVQEAAFQLPLLAYVLIITFQSAGAFMFPWAIVTMCNAMPRRSNRVLAIRLKNQNEVGTALKARATIGPRSVSRS